MSGGLNPNQLSDNYNNDKKYMNIQKNNLLEAIEAYSDYVVVLNSYNCNHEYYEYKQVVSFEEFYNDIYLPKYIKAKKKNIPVVNFWELYYRDDNAIDKLNVFLIYGIKLTLWHYYGSESNYPQTNICHSCAKKYNIPESEYTHDEELYNEIFDNLCVECEDRMICKLPGDKTKCPYYLEDIEENKRYGLSLGRYVNTPDIDFNNGMCCIEGCTNKADFQWDTDLSKEK